MKKFSLLLFIVFAISACSKLSDKESAEILLKKAQQMTDANQLNGAKIRIDSIHAQYPKELAIRKKANTLFNKIVLKEQRKNLIYIDSVLSLMQEKKDSATKNFAYEKDEKYQNIGNYVHKRLRTEQNIRRSYLKPYVQEDGEFYFSSIYYGKQAINHQSIRISVGDTYIESIIVPLSDGYNHSFEEYGERWETVIYKGKENIALCNFIIQNADKNIVISLQGKSNYRFGLQKTDISAITETLQLGVFLSDLNRLKKDQIKTQRKILILEQRLSVAE